MNTVPWFKDERKLMMRVLHIPQHKYWLRRRKACASLYSRKFLDDSARESRPQIHKLWLRHWERGYGYCNI